MGPGVVDSDDALVEADGFPALVQEAVVGDFWAVAGVVGPSRGWVAGELCYSRLSTPFSEIHVEEWNSPYGVISLFTRLDGAPWLCRKT